MKRILTLVCTLALSLSHPAMAAPKSTTAIQIIMDDSGVLQSPENAQRARMMILGHLKGFTRKRALAHARMDVISTSYGRTVWSGIPLELKRNAARAQDLVQKTAARHDACNNLPGAFDELKSNLASLAREGYQHVHIVVFSSLIHTPLPCDKALRISLPQLPPAKGDINGALTASDLIRATSFYWVSPHQKRVWEEFLSPAFGWALAKGVRITFMDEERSLHALQSRLEVER